MWVRIPPRVPEERVRDVQLSAYLASPGERRNMRSSDNILQWLEDYWREKDPTPATAENELLQVYIQRAAYLEKSFPETPFGEWPSIWEHFGDFA